MRYPIISLIALLGLAIPASAGSIRPAACPMSAAQDAGIKDYLRMGNAETCKRFNLAKADCTDAAVKALDPTAGISAITAAAYQSSTDGWYCATVYGQAEAGTKWRNAKQIEELYNAATPAERAQVDVILKVPQP